MTISNIYDFKQARNSIIRDALLELNVIDANDDPEHTQLEDASRYLNRMLKSWQKFGNIQWLNRNVTIFPAVGQRVFKLGDISVKMCDDDDLVITSLSSNVSVGANTITVNNADGISINDKIGIITGTNTHWAVVTGISSNTVTLNSNTGHAFSAGTKVYAYTNNISRPIKIHSLRYVQGDSNEIPINLISHQEYDEIPNKNTQSSPNSYAILQQNNYLKVSVYPSFSSASHLLKSRLQIQFADLIDASNDIDVPDYFYDAAVFGLANRLSNQYSVSIQKAEMVSKKAVQSLESVKGMLQETADNYYDYGG